jgi:calcineurin-like phosphoesterase family protein
MAAEEHFSATSVTQLSNRTSILWISKIGSISVFCVNHDTGMIHWLHMTVLTSMGGATVDQSRSANMADIWFISDTHFYHENIIQYCGRPFKDAEFMNEFMIEEWNKVVKPQDHVWHLGDVAMGFGGNQGKITNLLSRLNGKKRACVGNHDPIKAQWFQQGFEKIELWRGFKDEGFTCVHIPLQIEQLRDGHVCVHGHIHNNLVTDKFGKPDPRYICVCVEHTNYAPVNMDVIKEKVNKVRIGG